MKFLNNLPPPLFGNGISMCIGGYVQGFKSSCKIWKQLGLIYLFFFLEYRPYVLSSVCSVMLANS